MADAPALQIHFANWSIVQYMSRSVPWPYPADGARHFLADAVLPAMAQGRRWTWAVTLPPSDEAVGLLDWVPPWEPGGFRGLWLAEPLQGRGLMTEAVTAFQDLIFLELGVERIEVRHAVQNLASRRLKEKTGGRYLAIVPATLHAGDQAEAWEVTRDAWISTRQAARAPRDDLPVP